MRVLLGCLLAAVLGVPGAAAQEGKAFFDDNCGVCHTIGGEPTGAPDLKGVTTRHDRVWLRRFIRSPHEAAEHDREAAAIVKQYDDMMPETEGASNETIEAVLRYIEEQSAGPAAAAAAPAPAPPPPASAADLLLGRELFEGRRRLAGGGPPCVSCHRVAAVGGYGGGALGPDLTAVNQRLGGMRGLSAWLGNPPTPVMRAIYRKTRFTEPEHAALVAFLDAQAAAPAGPPPNRLAFLLIGAGGFVAVLVVMGAVWSGRFRAVRRPLVARARASVGGRP